MDFRLAAIDDLPQIKAMFTEIVCDMNSKNVKIWNERYPNDFFEEDIRQNRLYLLTESEIIAAFSLTRASDGKGFIVWSCPDEQAIYLNRLGVNVRFLGQGIGSIMLQKAKETAKSQGAKFLRLLVVDSNYPAINLYRKNGFLRAKGEYDFEIYGRILHEFPYEIML